MPLGGNDYVIEFFSVFVEVFFATGAMKMSDRPVFGAFCRRFGNPAVIMPRFGHNNVIEFVFVFVEVFSATGAMKMSDRSVFGTFCGDFVNPFVSMTGREREVGTCVFVFVEIHAAFGAMIMRFYSAFGAGGGDFFFPNVFVICVVRCDVIAFVTVSACAGIGRISLFGTGRRRYVR